MVLFPLDLSKRLGIAAETLDQIKDISMSVGIMNDQNEEELA